MAVLSVKRQVALVVVGEQHRVRDDVRGDCFSKERPSTIRDDLRHDATAPFNCSENDGVLSVPPVSRVDGVYTVDARGLYWAFHRLLHNLFAAPQHVGLADRLAGEIGFG